MFACCSLQSTNCRESASKASCKIEYSIAGFGITIIIIRYIKSRSIWKHRYQMIKLVYIIIITKVYSYKLSLENHWAPHDHSKWNVQKCWRIKMIEHLSSLHSCCEYCDTDNIQLSNKVCISYTEKHELTNTTYIYAK